MENYFKNTKTLSHAIQEIASINLTPRPYNRFEPDKTIWWLAPSTDWPAYKYGKIFFDAGKDIAIPGNGIFCGLYVEKGIDNKSRNYYKNQTSLIMDHDWLWNKLVSDVQEKKVQAVISKLMKKNLGDKLYLAIKSSYITPDSLGNSSLSVDEFYGEKRKLPSDLLVFSMENDVIKLEEKKLKNFNSTAKDYLLSEVANSKNVPGLIRNIKKATKIDWLWVDFCIGVYLEKGISITPANLWKRYLEVWTPWLRKNN